jgi:hypothetical protein
MNRETAHWTASVATLTASVATLTSVAYGGYWVGNWMGNEEGQLQIAKLELALAQSERNREQSERTISEQAKED